MNDCLTMLQGYAEYSTVQQNHTCEYAHLNELILFYLAFSIYYSIEMEGSQ